MPNWSGTVLTTKGRALQAKVEAGTPMNITKLKVGDGTLGTGQSIDPLSDLVSPKQIIDIVSLTPLAGGVCKITGLVTNKELENGYYVRELGVFAQDPDLGEILYAYTADGAPDFLPAAGGPVAVSNQLVINLAFSNATSIVANIALDGLVTVEMLNAAIDEHNTDPDAHPNMFLPLAGGTVTGHIIGVTADQFDNSEKIATSKFVQRALGNYAGTKGYTAAATMAATDLGKYVTVSGNFTLTLPNMTGAIAGAKVSIANTGTNTTVTLVPNGGGSLIWLPGIGTVSSFALTSAETVEFVWNGTLWMASGGFGGAYFGSNGYQKMPSGLIIQWGFYQIATAATPTWITLPIAFPNAVLNAVVCAGTTGFATLVVMENSRIQVSNSVDNVKNHWIAVGY